MEFTSSWLSGGRFDDAAILKGRRKHDTRTCGRHEKRREKHRQDWLIEAKKFSAFYWFFWFWHPERIMDGNQWDILHTARPKITSSCSRYSSSASTIEKTKLLRFLMLSACGDLMYSSTICFHRRRHSQPRKKLWTFLIFFSSAESADDSQSAARFETSLRLLISSCCSTEGPAAPLILPRPGVDENDERVVSLRSTQTCCSVHNEKGWIKNHILTLVSREERKQLASGVDEKIN